MMPPTLVHAKWLSNPGPPREMTNAVLADYKQGLEP
jgi:hypothetical protein